ncbi:unnamed protein product [Dicrocoelium dendriticum]|nr:unnamed protein product [Dicrocoelium dendriticum]
MPFAPDIIPWTAFNPNWWILVFSTTVVLFLLRRYSYYKDNKSPISVDCWFCSNKNIVDKVYENSFVCSSCDQYNGFSDDGGYNRIIPGHFASAPAHCKRYSRPGSFVTQSDILCDTCSSKQSTIVRKLADFEPISDDRWDTELKAYTDQLERNYPLCKNCFLASRNRIHEVNLKVLPTFLDWWNTLRSHIFAEDSAHRRTKKKRKIKSTESLFASPWLLHFLLRLSSFVCISVILTGLVVTALTNHYCLVRTRQHLSTFDHIVSRLRFNHTQLHAPSWCPSLLILSGQLNVPLLAQFWFCLLCLLIQLLLIFRRWWSHEERPHKPHGLRLGPIVLLIDVCVLILVLDYLISLTGPIFFNSTGGSTDGHFSLRYYGCAILGIVLIPLIFVSLLSIKAWLTFCSSDWRAQKRALAKSWPTRGLSDSTFDDTSDRITSRSPSVYSSIGGGCSAYSSSLKQDHLLPDLAHRLNISPPKSLFRASVLSWPPRDDRLRGTTTSVGASSYATKYRSAVPCYPTPPTQDVSECSEDSFITSVSRLRTRSQGTQQSTPHRRKSRSRKRSKHRGLIRFCLSVLFGRVDTLSDVLSELISLLNAMLIGLVIYALGRLFMRLISLF